MKKTCASTTKKNLNELANYLTRKGKRKCNYLIALIIFSSVRRIGFYLGNLSQRHRGNFNPMSVTFKSLTPGKLTLWLESQPTPMTREEAKERKRVKRLIRLAKDEEE
jgi:hypothetical protein